MINFKTVLGCTLALALVAAQARAEVITPTAVTPSSEFAPAINLINGSGLSGVGAVETQLHDNNENNIWQSFDAVNAPFDSIGETVEFDLGGNFDLLDSIIWQYNGPDGFGTPTPQREIKDLDVAVSSAAAGPFTPIGTITLAPALDQTVAGFNEPAQTFGTAATNVRRVQFTIQSVQTGQGDGFAGLSEVRFNVVPEPTTLVLGALSILGLTCGRRRS